MSTADTQDSASEETGTKATGKESLPEVTFPNTKRRTMATITTRRASSRTQLWMGSTGPPEPANRRRPDSPATTR